jgi:hypothetical protein
MDKPLINRKINLELISLILLITTTLLLRGSWLLSVDEVAIFEGLSSTIKSLGALI